MRKVVRKTHLWLGLLSGIVVFIVCLTGALFVFENEIKNATQPWRKVQVTQHTYEKLPESKLIAIADKATGQKATAITTGRSTDATWVDYRSEKETTTVFLNPYSGKILHIAKKGKDSFDFFKFIKKGHKHLWLPREIGKPIVSYATLLFLIELLTGLFIWLPKRMNRKTLGNMLSFTRPFRWRRFIFEMHTVAGLYLIIPLIVLCLTGMMFGLAWFSQGAYSLVSGGKAMESYIMPESDTTLLNTASIDQLSAKLLKEEPRAVQFSYALPQNEADVYRVSVVHKSDSYYKQDNRYFDKSTLQELQGKGPWSGRYNEVSAADKMMRMNIDIHTGRIFGLAGKILMFIASIIGASLSLTGLALWLRKR